MSFILFVLCVFIFRYVRAYMPVVKIPAFPTIVLEGLWKKKILYIYCLCIWRVREGAVHARVSLREREKTEVSVDLSICSRVATESCHVEELIALQNLSLGTVKIRTVYWEQGSFLVFLSTLTHALCKAYPCKVCIWQVCVKPLLTFLLYPFSSLFFLQPPDNDLSPFHFQLFSLLCFQ